LIITFNRLPKTIAEVLGMLLVNWCSFQGLFALWPFGAAGNLPCAITPQRHPTN
jgi:hypothetical protein